MATNCPACSARLSIGSIDIACDSAQCGACGRTFRFSSLDQEPPATPLSPPSGAWDIDDGAERRIGATTRSWWVLAVIPFGCLFAAALAGIYGSQFVTGFKPLLSLLGVAFIPSTIWFAWAIAMGIGGRVEVRLRAGSTEVFSGVGPLGRAYDLADYSRVSEDRFAFWRRGSVALRPGRPGRVILLDGRRPTQLCFLNHERRRFILEALRPLVLARPCLACNYDLRATPTGSPCPECGRPRLNPAAPAPPT